MATGVHVNHQQDNKREGRQLGPFECIVTNLTIKHSTAIFWHAATFHTAHPLGEHDVINACKILARKQEVLQMRIVPDDDAPNYTHDFHFELMDNPEQIDFSFVKIKTRPDWPTLATDDHEERKFDVVNGPLWRIILAKVERTEDNEFPHEYVILFKFVHAIVDGLSVYDFVNQQFFTVLSALLNGGDAEESIPYSQQVKPIEELFPESKQPFNFFTKMILYFLRLKNRKFKPSPLPDYRFPDEQTPKKELTKDTLLVPIQFEKSLCDAVIVAAKAHAITVHSVLLCAGVIALSRVADDAGVKLPSLIRQIWPVSRRKDLCINTPGPLCFIALDVTTLHKPATNITLAKFWIECSKVNMQVEKEKSIDKSILLLRGAKYVHDEAVKSNILTVMSELSPPPNLFLSNIGKMDFDSDYIGKDGSVNMRITEQYFCLTGTDFCPLTQYLLNFKSRFMYTICYNPRKVSRRFVDSYIDYLKDILVTYCMQNTTNNEF